MPPRNTPPHFPFRELRLYVRERRLVRAGHFIHTEALTRGQKLPAERDLADDWDAAYQTVRRAMRELRERDLIVPVLGKGTFVTDKP
jgi:DNA-binding FadR family transcriptional regulator